MSEQKESKKRKADASNTATPDVIHKKPTLSSSSLSASSSNEKNKEIRNDKEDETKKDTEAITAEQINKIKNCKCSLKRMLQDTHVTITAVDLGVDECSCGGSVKHCLKSNRRLKALTIDLNRYSIYVANRPANFTTDLTWLPSLLQRVDTQYGETFSLRLRVVYLTETNVLKTLLGAISHQALSALELTRCGIDSAGWEHVLVPMLTQTPAWQRLGELVIDVPLDVMSSHHTAWKAFCDWLPRSQLTCLSLHWFPSEHMKRNSNNVDHEEIARNRKEGMRMLIWACHLTINLQSIQLHDLNLTSAETLKDCLDGLEELLANLLKSRHWTCVGLNHLTTDHIIYMRFWNAWWPHLRTNQNVAALSIIDCPTDILKNLARLDGLSKLTCLLPSHDILTELTPHSKCDSFEFHMDVVSLNMTIATLQVLQVLHFITNHPLAKRIDIRCRPDFTNMFENILYPRFDDIRQLISTPNRPLESVRWIFETQCFEKHMPSCAHSLVKDKISVRRVQHQVEYLRIPLFYLQAVKLIQDAEYQDRLQQRKEQMLALLCGFSRALANKKQKEQNPLSVILKSPMYSASVWRPVMEFL